jgi:ADP-heptose:LPS heptosyltransferase
MRQMDDMPGPRVVTYVDLDLVGDGLTKLPYVRAVRHAFPDGELIWVAGRGGCA